ncbi:MAG: hypothetical protein JWM76_4190 [Pseudonocardiales bacterium]|nr:hypothetical protein [Pseudonocardiales bacterium]
MTEDVHGYLVQDWLNNQARCQCGWTGQRRFLRGGAVLDVFQHSSETGHLPIGAPPSMPVSYAAATVVP